MLSSLATIAFALVSYALYISDGHYEPLALQLTVAAALICLVALAVRWPKSVDHWAERGLPFLLALVFGAQLYGLWSKPPGLYVVPTASPAVFHSGLVAAALIGASYLAPVRAIDQVRFPLLVASFCVIGGWMIFAAPKPFIDVWYFEQRAADLLLHGGNPWAADYPNIYGHTMFFGAQLINSAGRIQSHTYPPLSVLMTVPGWLVGDARWSLVASTAGAAVLVVGAARRLGLRAGHPAELGIALFLFHSRSLFMVEEAWTEPFVVVWAAFVLYALTLERRLWLWIALAGFLSVKQYGLLWLPALWLGARLRPSDLLKTGLLCFAVELPFLIWDSDALWNGVVSYQFRLQFRPDSLSIPAWILRSGQQPPMQAGFVAAALAAALAVALGRSRPEPRLSRAALGGAFVFFAFFLFHKQAFFNYYWLVCGFLSMAVALSMNASTKKIDVNQ